MLHCPKMKTEAPEILCETKIHLRVSVFDIQVHNILHVAEEVELAGLVSIHWMYEIECYLKVLKDYVRQRAL